MINYYITLALAILITAFSHLLLKSGVNLSDSYIKSFFHWRTLSAYFFLGIAALLVVFAMKKIPLGQVTVLASINYAFILVLSKLFLKEPIHQRQYVGVLTIIAGIVLYNIESLLP
ncbi:MAG: hypothetical protein COA79_17245 [Planctomycetota bacterium]|nr:MAG: hypothetical protein COA79_17245 [Planctomycetota bacterium]